MHMIKTLFGPHTFGYRENFSRSDIVIHPCEAKKSAKQSRTPLNSIDDENPGISAQLKWINATGSFFISYIFRHT